VAGADAYERELLDAFDSRREWFGHVVDTQDREDAADERPRNKKTPRWRGLCA